MKNAVRRMRPLLGTYVEIGTVVPEEFAYDAVQFENAFSVIEKIQKLLSFHDPLSDLSRLNYSQGQWLALNPLSIRVLRLAKVISKASGGLFNPTVGGKLQSLGYLPEHAPVFNVSDQCLPVGTEADIEFFRGKVRLARSVRVVLDGIAKGYAVDCAIRVLQQEGLQNGWVNAGGDLRVFGDLILPLQVRRLEGLSEPLGGIQNCAVATSLVHEKYDKDFPGWVVSSSVGNPRPGEWTVLAKKAWRADALTKVASLCADHEREELLGRLGGRCL